MQAVSKSPVLTTLGVGRVNLLHSLFLVVEMVLWEFEGLIEALQDNKLYASSTILMLAVDQQLVPQLDRQFYRKARIVLGRIICVMGDKEGIIDLEGQAPIPAWTGRKWKQGFLILVSQAKTGAES